MRPAEGRPNLPLERARPAEISRHGGALERQAGLRCEQLCESSVSVVGVLYVHFESLGPHGGMRSRKIQREYTKTLRNHTCCQNAPLWPLHCCISLRRNMSNITKGANAKAMEAVLENGVARIYVYLYQ